MWGLVTDVHLRNAVTGVRGLGRGGVRVAALGPGLSAGGLWSRYARARGVGSDVAADPEGFVTAAAGLASRCEPAVVYPGQEAAIDALLANWGRMPDSAVFPYAGPEPLQALRTKSGLPAVASAAGVATPATICEGTPREVARMSSRTPLIVKPGRPGGALRASALAESPDELGALLAALPASEPLIVQERRPGRLVAMVLVLDREGGVVARFQQATFRTWPTSAGETALAVGVPPDERFVEQAADVLRAAEYWGLAHLQFLETRAGRELIDVNPRFYGSMPLALACGVNPPAAWHAVTTHGQAPSRSTYRTGVTYRWFEADFTAAMRGSPRLLLQRARRPKVGSMWARDDPLASAILASSVLAKPLRRRLTRLLPGRGKEE